MNQPQGNPQVTVITLSVSELRDLVRGEVVKALAGGTQGKPNPNGEPLLSVEELAVILRVKKSWIYWRTFKKDSGQIPHVKVGRYPRFLLSEVYCWLESQKKNAIK